MDVAGADHLLATTRAVRRRLDLDRPVGRETVLDCIRVAVQAPTASNTQTWRWLAIDDPDTRRQLADLFAEVTVPKIERRRATNRDPQTARVYDSALYLTQILDRVPVLVVPCVVGRPDGPKAMPAAAFYGSIFPAVWSFQLALRARGLGSVLTTPFAGELDQQYRSILDLPATMTPVAMLPVAYTIGVDFKPAKRPPVETITRWNRWSD